MTDLFDVMEVDGFDALKSLGWLCSSKGIQLPTLPADHMSRLQEFSPSSVFATGENLIPFLSQQHLIRSLTEAQWPDTGLAIRYVETRSWAFWQMLLVGRVNLVSIDLRIFATESENPLAEANYANTCLSAHLETEQQMSRYLSTGPQNDGETAHVLMYGNPAGGATSEVYRTFIFGSGPSSQQFDGNVFIPTANQSAPEEVIFRP